MAGQDFPNGKFLFSHDGHFGLGGGGGVQRGVWHKAMVSVCLPLAAPIGLSPSHILTLRTLVLRCTAILTLLLGEGEGVIKAE